MGGAKLGHLVLAMIAGFRGRFWNSFSCRTSRMGLDDALLSSISCVSLR